MFCCNCFFPLTLSSSFYSLYTIFTMCSDNQKNVRSDFAYLQQPSTREQDSRSLLHSPFPHHLSYDIITVILTDINCRKHKNLKLFQNLILGLYVLPCLFLFYIPQLAPFMLTKCSILYVFSASMQNCHFRITSKQNCYDIARCVFFSQCNDN